MVTIESKGDFKKATRFFKKSRKAVQLKNATSVAEKCIQRLKAVTPVETGITANSWTYKIERGWRKTTIQINNTNIQNGINIALLLEFGHRTKGGGWVSGKNYIEPEIQKAYNEVLNKTWKELERL
jgi:hypothetical protein